MFDNVEICRNYSKQEIIDKVSDMKSLAEALEMSADHAQDKTAYAMVFVWVGFVIDPIN